MGAYRWSFEANKFSHEQAEGLFNQFKENGGYIVVLLGDAMYHKFEMPGNKLVFYKGWECRNWDTDNNNILQLLWFTRLNDWSAGVFIFPASKPNEHVCVPEDINAFWDNIVGAVASDGIFGLVKDWLWTEEKFPKSVHDLGVLP